MGISSERGTSLVVALMTMVLMAALGAALVLITMSETMIAANFRAGLQTFYAADAAFERALADLRTVPDWTAVLGGGSRSSFTDGQPAGVRTLSDGTAIDLGELANVANCQKPARCTDADMAAKTSERPWGANNPRWTLFSHGKLADSVGTHSVESPCYVLVFVADDPSENDGDPTRDGVEAGGLSNPGLGILSVRAEAFGPRHAHRVIEATVAHELAGGVEPGAEATASLRVISWREVR